MSDVVISKQGGITPTTPKERINHINGDNINLEY